MPATELFAGNRNSVVIIKTRTGQGGVVIDAAGLVVTNRHVIAEDATAMVVLAGSDSYDVNNQAITFAAKSPASIPV
jgi:S1-C subfamily serine protease